MTFEELQLTISRANEMIYAAGFILELRVKQANGRTSLNMGEQGKSAYIRNLTVGTNDECAIAGLAVAVELALDEFNRRLTLKENGNSNIFELPSKEEEEFLN
jgi:hypothetical protein